MFTTHTRQAIDHLTKARNEMHKAMRHIDGSCGEDDAEFAAHDARAEVVGAIFDCWVKHLNMMEKEGRSVSRL